MQQVTEEFLKSLTGSITPVVRVDAWRAGRLIAADLPVTGGQVTITAGQAIRSRVSVSVTDGSSEEFKAGSLVPRRQDDILHPLSGTELRISAGLKLAERDEWVALGRYVIVSADSGEEQWHLYDRPGGSTAVVNAAATTSLECSDLARKVQDDRFLAVEQPKTATTVAAEIARLLWGVVDWRAPDGMPGVGVPADITYDADRLDACIKLAAAADMELIFRPDGVATLQSPSLSAPVWTVASGDGEGSGLMTFSREVTRDGFYNAVQVTGATEEGKLPVRATATLNEGPSRFNGPLGRIPFFFPNPLDTTQPSAERSAITRLGTLVKGRSQTISVTCAWNPALEVGDTILIRIPTGEIPARVIEATWPLLPGPMTLKATVDPDALAGL